MAESGNPQERLAAALGYVFTPVVPIVLLAGSARDNLFLKRHAAQALLWSVGLLILLVATVVLLIAMLRSTWLAILLLPILIVVPFIPGIVMGTIVYRGQDLRLPIIAPLAERLFPPRRF